MRDCRYALQNRYSWYRTIPTDDCYIQFLESSKYLTIATAVAAFYLPVVILCVVYHRIYRETRRHQRNIYELQAALRRRPRPNCETTVQSADGNLADGAGSRGCLGACRNRAASAGLGRRGCCNWMQSGECGVDEVEESFEEETTTRLQDDGLPTSTTSTSMCQSQSVPGDTRQVLINSITDMVVAPVDQSENSTMSPPPVREQYHVNTSRRTVPCHNHQSEKSTMSVPVREQYRVTTSR